jgi:hypothetical protein
MSTDKLDRQLARIRATLAAILSVAIVANLAFGIHRLEDGSTSGVVFGLWHLGLAAYTIYSLVLTPAP